jgi:hypothetical protein
VIRYRKTSLCRAARTSCALLCASFAGPALAQAASDLAGLSATTMLQTLLGLAVVIGLLFLAAFLLRKVNGGSHGCGGCCAERYYAGGDIGQPEERGADRCDPCLHHLLRWFNSKHFDQLCGSSRKRRIHWPCTRNVHR